MIIGIILAGVSVPHLIDDVLFGIPDEFGLTNLQAQVLAGVFSAPLIFIFNLVGRQKRAGIVGAGFLGIFLVLAGFLKHVPLMLQPGPYWSGLFSETLIFALFLSSLSLFGLSLYALLNNKA